MKNNPSIDGLRQALTFMSRIPIAAESWSSRDFYTLRISFGRSALMLRADSQSVTVTAQHILSARLRAACALFYNFYITDIGHHDIFINLRRIIFGVSSLCAHPKRLSAVLYMCTHSPPLCLRDTLNDLYKKMRVPD